MPYRSLADFLEELGQAGELTRVEAQTSPLLEVSEITSRAARSAGAALLFGAVSGHDMPLVSNLLGTEARICRALGAHSLADVARRVALLVAPAEPEGWFDRLKTAPHESLLRKLGPRNVKSGACQQVVRLASDVDLGELPVLQSLPGEAGRTITAGQLFTWDAESGRSVGRHDVQLLDRNRLAACFAAHDEPARLLGLPQRRSEPLPVAVVLGGDPAGLLAAAAPLPPGFDACALAGFLREKPLELVRCRSIDLDVPADAEIVVEGYIDRSEAPISIGPRCTPLGTYTRPHVAPVIHVTALTHRANPVYPAMVPGRPPNEACVVAQAMWQVLLPLVRLAIPELVDYDFPMFGGPRHWAVLSIRKTYAGQARKVAHAAWGIHGLMFAKVLVVVDDVVNVHDQGEVLGAVAAHVAPGRDVFFQQGPPDPLDAAAPAGTLGQCMAIDATAKLPEEIG